MSNPAIDHRQPIVTHVDLAVCFLKIALVSFGGGVSAWARQVIIEERRWLTDEEFLTALTLSRLLPGPNVTNLAVYVGTRFHGLSGAGAALAGLTLVPLAIMLSLGVMYFRYHHLPALQAVLTGVVAGGVGLTLSMGVKAGLAIIRQPMAVALAAAAFLGMAILRWPLWLVLVGLAPVGMAWYWPREKKKNQEEEPAA
jgi:chromate transporter